MNDVVLTEIHKIKDESARRHHNDVRALLTDVMTRQGKSGHRLIVPGETASAGTTSQRRRFGGNSRMKAQDSSATSPVS